MKLLQIIWVVFLLLIILDWLRLKVISWDFYPKYLGYMSEMLDGKMNLNIYIWILARLIMSVWYGTILYFLITNDADRQTIILSWLIMWLAMYGTYNFTNYSFVKWYPLMVVIVDTCRWIAQWLIVWSVMSYIYK